MNFEEVEKGKTGRKHWNKIILIRISEALFFVNQKVGNQDKCSEDFRRDQFIMKNRIHFDSFLFNKGNDKERKLIQVFGKLIIINFFPKVKGLN